MFWQTTVVQFVFASFVCLFTHFTLNIYGYWSEIMSFTIKKSQGIANSCNKTVIDEPDLDRSNTVNTMCNLKQTQAFRNL